MSINRPGSSLIVRQDAVDVLCAEAKVSNSARTSLSETASGGFFRSISAMESWKLEIPFSIEAVDDLINFLARLLRSDVHVQAGPLPASERELKRAFTLTLIRPGEIKSSMDQFNVK